MKKFLTLLFIVFWVFPIYADNVITTAGQSSKINITQNGDYAINSTDLTLGSGTHTQTSGTNKIVSIAPTYNQTSGTASNTDLLINRTETAVGSGSQYLIDTQVGGSSIWRLFSNGSQDFLNTSNYGIYPSSVSLIIKSPQPIVLGISGDIESGYDAISLSNSSTLFELTSGNSEQAWIKARGHVNQSGTGSYVGFLLDMYETAVGSGTKKLMDLRLGGITKLQVDNAGRMIVDSGMAGVVGTPSIALGDGDSGFYESADDTIAISISGSNRFSFTGGFFNGVSSRAARLYDTTPTNTSPTFMFNGDPDTGIGGVADSLSLISGAKEMMRLVETGTATTDQVIISPGTISGAEATPALAFGDGDTGVYESTDDVLNISIAGSRTWAFTGTSMVANNGNGAGILSETSSATNPTLNANRGDDDTGLGHAAADQLSLIAGAKEMMRLVETGTASTDQVIISPGTISGAAATPALAFGDGDSGMYESSDDSLVFAFGGGADWLMSGSTFQSFISGHPYMRENGSSTAAPAYSFVGDTDTGLHTASADTVSLIAGGVEGARITEDTNTLLFQTMGGVIRKVTDVNAATYDLLATDHILSVSYTGTAAVTSLTLPTAQCDGAEDNGRIVIIKDSGGGATANNITIDTEGSEKIDGQDTKPINVNYQSISLYCYSANWYIF